MEADRNELEREYESGEHFPACPRTWRTARTASDLCPSRFPTQKKPPRTAGVSKLDSCPGYRPKGPPREVGPTLDWALWSSRTAQLFLTSSSAAPVLPSPPCVPLQRVGLISLQECFSGASRWHPSLCDASCRIRMRRQKRQGFTPFLVRLKTGPETGTTRRVKARLLNRARRDGRLRSRAK